MRRQLTRSIVGWDHDHIEFRVFAVERVGAVKVTNQRFEPREDFNFHALKNTAFRFIWGQPKQVRIRFSPEQATYATERIWHVSQKVFEEENGSVVLQFSVADLQEVKRWLIGWGAAEEVLEPIELANDVLNECRSVVSRLGPKSAAKHSWVSERKSVDYRSSNQPPLRALNPWGAG